MGETPRTMKDVVRCPKCRARDIVYTCEPKCCFNHVCSECRATFQLVTRKRDGNREPAPVTVPLQDSSDPTAACAGCESLRVYVIEGGIESTLACADCGATLDLLYEDVAEG